MTYQFVPIFLVEFKFLHWLSVNMTMILPTFSTPSLQFAVSIAFLLITCSTRYFKKNIGSEY